MARALVYGPSLYPAVCVVSSSMIFFFLPLRSAPLLMLHLIETNSSLLAGAIATLDDLKFIRYSTQLDHVASLGKAADTAASASHQSVSSLSVPCSTRSRQQQPQHHHWQACAAARDGKHLAL